MTRLIRAHKVDLLSGCGLPPPRNSTRDFKRDVAQARRRGARRGLANRYALRNLPPLEEDEP